MDDDFPVSRTGFVFHKHGEREFVIHFVVIFPQLGMQFAYHNKLYKETFKERMFVAEKIGEREELEEAEAWEESLKFPEDKRYDAYCSYFKRKRGVDVGGEAG